MIKVEINNKQSLVEIEDGLDELFTRIARKAAEMEGYDHGEISIALVDNQEIRELNKEYRDKDEATDVLSFPMGDDIWGDIVISAERARSQAKEYGHSLQRELGYLLVHSILHLLGYDHKSDGEKDEMRQKEERILRELNLKRQGD